MKPPVLELQNISKSFGSKKVLSNISLALHQHEILGLIGISGGGKSTLLKILVGFLQPDTGTITLEGKNLSGKTGYLRSVVGYVTQENSFYERLTVEENMQYYANLYAVPRKERKKRIQELLESVQLAASKKTLASSLSGGMKRRLDFALALLHNPKIVVLDEPTTGLDPVLVSQFWKIVQKRVKEDPIAVIVTSHILSEIKDNCTRVSVLAKGTLAQPKKITPSTNILNLLGAES